MNEQSTPEPTMPFVWIKDFNFDGDHKLGALSPSNLYEFSDGDNYRIEDIALVFPQSEYLSAYQLECKLKSLQSENAALKTQLAELKELFPPAFLKDAREWLESEDAPDDYKESARLIIAALGDAPQTTEPK